MATSGMEDLFAQLDAASSKLRAEDAACGREYTGPRIPHIEDAYLSRPAWRPPVVTAAFREAQALFEAGRRSQASFCSGARVEGEFSQAGLLKPKYLDTLEASRVLQPDRNFSKPNGYKGYRGQSGGEMPATSDDMCSEQHRNWLGGHYVQREAHLHPMHHALKRADRIEEEIERTTDALKCSGNEEEKHTLRVKTEGLEKKLAKAKSDPALVNRTGTPEGHFKHMYGWAGSDRAGDTFQQKAPWQALAEGRELVAAKGTAPRRADLKPNSAAFQKTQMAAGPSYLPAVTAAAFGPRLTESHSLPSFGATAAATHKAVAARPPTGTRPPTGAFGTSRVGSPARPRTGALANVGKGVLRR